MKIKPDRLQTEAQQQQEQQRVNQQEQWQQLLQHSLKHTVSTHNEELVDTLRTEKQERTKKGGSVSDNV